MITHDIPKETCPYCGHMVDAATEVTNDGDKPEEGDLMVCFYCGGVSALDADNHHRKLDMELFRKEEPENAALIDKMSSAIRKRN